MSAGRPVGAFGNEAATTEVREAHDSAVRAALGFLEDHAAFSRTGRGGIVQVDTAGFVAAAFTHHTSRAGDPQLHSHVLVANKVLCADGRWRSLDGREQFAFQKAAGMLYNATLRVELSARLGVGLGPGGPQRPGRHRRRPERPDRAAPALPRASGGEAAPGGCVCVV
ncbi:MAG: MobF family relaxase [Acidimicrobiia bacterium]